MFDASNIKYQIQINIRSTMWVHFMQLDALLAPVYIWLLLTALLSCVMRIYRCADNFDMLLTLIQTEDFV